MKTFIQQFSCAKASPLSMGRGEIQLGAAAEPWGCELCRDQVRPGTGPSAYSWLQPTLLSVAFELF